MLFLVDIGPDFFFNVTYCIFTIMLNSLTGGGSGPFFNSPQKPCPKFGSGGEVKM